MTYSIEEIEDIGTVYAARLAGAGIATTEHLLKACAARAGREAVSEKTRIPARLLLEWANMADLMRISGVGPEFAELLGTAGVDTVKELRRRSAESLAQAMAQAMAEKRVTRRAPSAKMVQGWIAQAKQLEPTISY